MLVSVVIPAFDAAVSIERAIASAAAQTLADLEILVVDDGCTDDTAEVASAMARADARIRLLPSIGNRGVSAARNRGLREAAGDWIAMLDADDAFDPARLERLIDMATAHDADVVVDNIAYYDWGAARLTGVLAMPRGDGVRRIDTATYFRNCITGRSPFDLGQLKPVLRRSFLRRHPVGYPEDVRHGEDFLFLAHLLLAGAAMVLTDAPLYRYTERHGSISRDPSSVTRTVENCRRMRDDTLALLDHPGVRDNRDLIVPLRRRVRAIRWHQSWERVYYAVRRRDFLAISKIAISDWRIPILLGEGLIKKAIRNKNLSIIP